MIEELKHIFGPKCSAISVNSEVNEFINTPSKQMKFCEAVQHSFNLPLRIDSKNINCTGARRCLGFENNNDDLVKTISENNNIPVDFIRNALKNVPVLKNISHINLGITDYMEKEIRPDLYILFIQPSLVTVIMQSLAKHGISPSVQPYSQLSVCGNVFSNCYQNNKVSISFGCPESRQHGGINNDEVALAIPYKYAKQILKTIQL